MPYLATVPRSSAMTCLDKVSSPTTDTVTRISARLDTVPMPKTMTCLDKVPRPSSMTCHDKTPRPSACLGTMPHPSAMPRTGVSA